ncbi:hypothetical protein ABFT51_14035 [Paenibacillus peoriae]
MTLAVNKEWINKIDPNEVILFKIARANKEAVVDRFALTIQTVDPSVTLL